MVVLGRRQTGAIVAMMCALAAASGCLGPRQFTPSVDPGTVSDDAFMSYLAAVPVVTVDEGCRAMLILADGRDDCKVYEERRAKLTERGILSEAWKLEPQNVIDRGSIAAMTCRILHMRGGFNRAVFGAVGLGDRRYAHRELLYRGLLAEGTDYGAMQGPALAALFTRADEYMERHKLFDSPPVTIGKEEDLVRSRNAPATAPASDGK